MDDHDDSTQMKMTKRLSFTVIGLIAGLGLLAPPAEAGLVQGVKAVVAGVLQIPLATLVGTFTGPPVLGTVAGAASGAVNGVGLVTQGLLEIAGSGAAVAKTIAPFVLPFLF